MFDSKNNPESNANATNRSCDTLAENIITVYNGSMPVAISEHAFYRCATRIESMCSENSMVYNDVITEGGRALFIPSNMFMFLTDIVMAAKIAGTFSSSEGGHKYSSKIANWSSNIGVSEIVIVVKDGLIITVYFNWLKF